MQGFKAFLDDIMVILGITVAGLVFVLCMALRLTFTIPGAIIFGSILGYLALTHTIV